jgi:hypothetical protein
MRVYKATFVNVAVSAAQDLIQLKGATGKFLKVRRVWAGFTDTTLPTAQGLNLRMRYLPATVTDGSGGSTPAIAKDDQGDAAAGGVVLANNTTPATTSGTAQIYEGDGGHIYSGFDYTFPSDGRPILGSSTSTSFVFELLSTVSGTVHLSGGIEWGEEGG